MKKLLPILLSICLLLCAAVPVFATELTETQAPVRAENQCGEDIFWSFSGDTLTLSGSGVMDDFESEAPWAAHKKEIKKVVLSGGITYIGARSFSNYDALETVDFGNSLYEIGTAAFKSCDGLAAVYLPASFKVFGESSFASCSNLTEIHCSGRFPSFRLNCLWDTYGKIYYPADRLWGVQYIEQMETAFKGRIEFLASDGTDHYQPTEPTEATEPVTEPPTEPPTEAPTEPPTEPPTEAPTEKPTEVPTVPATQPPTAAPAEKPTEPAVIPDETEPPESKSWIGMVIICAVAIFLLLGMIVVKATSRRGKYSKKRKNRRKR